MGAVLAGAALSGDRCVGGVQVYLRSAFILNGVSVVWTGWLDRHRLDGTARLQLDDDSVDLRS